MGCSQGSAAGGMPAPSEGEQEVEVDPTVSPLLAQRGTPFANFLEKGHMAVVRATYFDECLAAGKPFQDRANIPHKAFINGPEVVQLWEEYGYAFLVIVSYSWLAREHPDPECYHLPRLVRALKAFRIYHEAQSWKGKNGHRIRELGGGVIIDFCTFWQGKHRTAEQTHIFKDGLKLINIPYGHSNVTALKLTGTPPSQVRRYDDRGWTHFESTVIDGKAPSVRHMYGERNVLTCDDSFLPNGEVDVLPDLARASRKAPLTPQRFREELEARRLRAEAKGEPLFTNGQDSPVILERYDASFEELCRSTKLIYVSMGWGAAEAKELALALQYFSALQELDLRKNRLDGEAFAELAVALGHCQALNKLMLNSNNLGPEADKALAEALPLCPALSTLWLNDNDLGRDGEAFAGFAAALGRCQALKELYLVRNRLGPEAATALAAALPLCPVLRELRLGGNNLSEEGKAAVRDAWRRQGVLAM